MRELTKNQADLLLKMHSGSPLLISFESEEPLYILEGVGPVNRATVRSLLRKGLLKESGDAMFGISQTYEPTAGAA